MPHLPTAVIVRSVFAGSDGASAGRRLSKRRHGVTVCSPDESPGAATLRECREELGIGIVLGPLRRVVAHRYPHGLVELHYFDCVTEDPTAEPDPAAGFVWVPAADLPTYPFPEANEPVLGELARAERPGPA